ncbi:MAG: sulfotransferase protein [Solirubrobacterales bacterium]|nr:sulfotransferase protein [Solirubrobacterales bacterium]
MALPTFFIIGAAKAGTTSLHFYLDQHPEIGMSTIKEPHFFAGPENGIPFPPERIGDLAEYEAIFDPAFGVRGEASPSYTNAPRRRGVPERIKQLVPDAKLIYLVRDPIERTLSHYQHSIASGEERRPLQQALQQLDEPSCYLACHSLFSRQLELYLEHFPATNVMVVDQAQLLDERAAVLRRVFSFLDVDASFSSERFEDELWRTGDRRISPPGHHKFIAGVVSPRAAWLPRFARRSLRRAYERTFWRPLEKVALDPGQRARLQEFYGPDVERLRTLTGQAFASWSV